jgi:NAD(P)-dependent dehydrogenase (short-subunit alcohol dehydrogenase family)
LVIVDLGGRGEELAAEARALGRRAHFEEFDLTELERIPTLVERLLLDYGHVDILVNGAAITGQPAPMKFLEVGEETWDIVYTVNLKAPRMLMQEVGRAMVAAGRGGRIVNVTSSGVYRAQSLPAYSSSKAALAQLTRIAAAELGEHDINVNSVVPGLTRTAMTMEKYDGDFDRAVREGPTANLLHRVSEPEDVAAAIVFLCLPESRQITAQAIHVSAGAIV